jgi:hypothetical protein
MSEQQTNSETVSELHAACARDYGTAQERSERHVAAVGQSATGRTTGNANGGSWGLR